MSNLVKNTAIYALGDIVPRLLSFISFPILTTYLTPRDYGIVNYVNTINIFLVIITFMCLNTYYLVHYFKVGGEFEQKKLLGNLSIFVIGSNIIFSVIAFCFGKYIFNWIGGEVDFYPYIAIGIGINFFNVFTILPMALFRVQERPLPLVLINISKGIIILVLTIYAVVVLEYKALGILYVSLIVTAVFGILYFAITIKHAIWKFNWSQIKQALVFSLPLVPGALSYFFVSASDRVLIDKYLDLNTLGIYSTASTLALMLNIFSYGAYRAFEPHFFKVYGTSEFKNQFIMVRNNFLFILLLGATGLALFAKEFFQIFSGEKFHIAYFYVPLILVGVMCSSMSMLYNTIITARGKTKITSAISIMGGALSVILNIILLPKIGVIAACITSTISMGSMLTLAMHYSKVNISHVKSVLAILLSALTVYLLVYLFHFENMAISIITKTVVYIVLLLLLVFILKIDIRRFIPIKTKTK